MRWRRSIGTSPRSGVQTSAGLYSSISRSSFSQSRFPSHDQFLDPLRGVQIRCHLQGELAVSQNPHFQFDAFDVGPRAKESVGTLPKARNLSCWRYGMSKESPLDDPRQKTDQGSHSQTDKPWEGNPEKEQRSGTKKSDPDKWQETNTH